MPFNSKKIVTNSFFTSSLTNDFADCQEDEIMAGGENNVKPDILDKMPNRNEQGALKCVQCNHYFHESKYVNHVYDKHLTKKSKKTHDSRQKNASKLDEKQGTIENSNDNQAKMEPVNDDCKENTKNSDTASKAKSKTKRKSTTVGEIKSSTTTINKIHHLRQENISKFHPKLDVIKATMAKGQDETNTVANAKLVEDSICDYCDETFESKRDLISHIKKEHMEQTQDQNDSLNKDVKKENEKSDEDDNDLIGNLNSEKELENNGMEQKNQDENKEKKKDKSGHENKIKCKLCDHGFDKITVFESHIKQEHLQELFEVSNTFTSNAARVQNNTIKSKKHSNLKRKSIENTQTNSDKENERNLDSIMVNENAEQENSNDNNDITNEEEGTFSNLESITKKTRANAQCDGGITKNSNAGTVQNQDTDDHDHQEDAMNSDLTAGEQILGKQTNSNHDEPSCLLDIKHQMEVDIGSTGNDKKDSDTSGNKFFTNLYLYAY